MAALVLSATEDEEVTAAPLSLPLLLIGGRKTAYSAGIITDPGGREPKEDKCDDDVDGENAEL